MGKLKAMIEDYTTGDIVVSESFDSISNVYVFPDDGSSNVRLRINGIIDLELENSSGDYDIMIADAEYVDYLAAVS